MVKDFALISARAFPPPYVRDFGEAPFSIIVFDKVRLSWESVKASCEQQLLTNATCTTLKTSLNRWSLRHNTEVVVMAAVLSKTE